MAQGKTYTLIPSFCLFVYPLLVGLDVFTTWKASPDLLHEANPVIIYWGLKWTGIIFCAYSIVCLTVFLSIKSNRYIPKYLLGEATNKALYYFFLLIVVWFYAHLVYSLYIPVNNYFAYLYLHTNGNSIFFNFAFTYVTFYNKYKFYHILMHLIALCAAIPITKHRTRKLSYFVQHG